MVTEIHLVLEGQFSVLQRHVALSITYDGLPHPSVFVPVGDFFGDQENGKNAPFENAYFARRECSNHAKPASCVPVCPGPDDDALICCRTD